jgi:L-ascorbate metabolism protein UlaG (beta-lactamase superfamily)
MARTLAPFLLLLTFVPTASAADLIIRWHGQSFFEIVTTAGTRIVLDPHAIEQFGRKDVPADLVLMSHLHNDHTQVGVIPNIKKAKQFNALKDLGTDGKRTEWNQIDEKFKDVHFRCVGVYHDDSMGMQRGKNGIWIMEVDGLKIVHLGDLGHQLSDAQLKRVGEVDILMIPVGGVYTLNGLDAAKVVDQLKPKRYVIPMHYGTEVYDDLLSNKYFLDEEKEKGAKIQKFPTNELKVKVDPKAAAPEQPTIAVLHWSGKGDK